MSDVYQCVLEAMRAIRQLSDNNAYVVNHLLVIKRCMDFTAGDISKMQYLLDRVPKNVRDVMAKNMWLEEASARKDASIAAKHAALVSKDAVIAAKDSMIERLLKKTADLEKQNAELRDDRIAELMRENARLKGDINALSDDMIEEVKALLVEKEAEILDQAEAIFVLETETTVLKEQNATLKEKLEKSTDAGDLTKEIEASLLKKEAKILELEDLISALKAETTVFKKQNETLENENQALEDLNLFTSQELSKKNQTIAELVCDSTEKTKCISENEAQIAALEKQVWSLTQSLMDRDKIMSSSAAELASKTKEVTLLNVQLTTIQNVVEKVVAESKLTELKLETLTVERNDEIALLKKANAKSLKKLATEKDVLEKRIKEMEKRESERFSEMSKKHTVQIQQLTKQCEADKTRIASLESDNSLLKYSNGIAGTVLQKAGKTEILVSELQEKNRELEVSLKDSKAVLKTFMERLKDAKKEIARYKESDGARAKTSGREMMLLVSDESLDDFYVEPVYVKPL